MKVRTARVGELAQQVRGVTYSADQAVARPTTGFLPILRANNITDDGPSFDDLVYVPESVIRAQQRLRANDVLIATSSGSISVVGKAVRIAEDFDGGFGAFCKVLRPSHGIDAAYFAHFFKTRHYRRRVSALAAGANINNLRNEHLDGFEIPVPSLPEQHRIAEVLDRAEALRVQRRQALAQLDALAESIFLETFGDPVTNPKRWHRVPLGDLLQRIESGFSPVCLDRPANSSEWAVLKLGAITRCKYDPSANKALPGSMCPDSSLEVQAGDLLFTRKNTYDLVAACVFVQATPPRLLLPDLIFRLCLKDDAALLPRFLHALLIHSGKRREVQRLAGGSAGSMPNISKAKLMTAMVEVPPLDLQADFIRRLESIDRLHARYRLAEAECDALFASLQHRAFRGEL